MRSTLLLSAAVLFGLAVTAQKPVEQKTETRVIIRDGAFGGEKPLVLVDGKVVADMNSVSPDRIASIDVLKGEGAVKLYGSEGKNGVIVVTTKRSQLDTIPTGNKQISKTVIINTIRKSDGSQDTTIIQRDSMMVNVDGESVIINGMPLEEFRDRSGKNMEVRVFKTGPDAERREIRIENMRRAFLGVATEQTESGALVKEVVAGSPAEKAGLLVNDRITRVDGQQVDGPESLVKVVGDHQPGDKVVVAWMRGKKNMKSEIVLDKPQTPQIVEGFKLPGMPEAEFGEFELALPRVFSEGSETKKMYLFKEDLPTLAAKPAPKIGLSVQDTEYGKGVQVTGVTADGAAAKSGIQLNDRVLRFDEIATNEVYALRMALERSRDKRSVMVHLQRGGKDVHVELIFPRQLNKAEL
jgi:TonB-dependent SusC/RagA subfamily outer membrane receptor